MLHGMIGLKACTINIDGSIGNTGSSCVKKLERITLHADQLDYLLNVDYNNEFEIQCFINGIEANFTIDHGTKILTLVDEYPSNIKKQEGWELKVYYFDCATGNLAEDIKHEHHQQEIELTITPIGDPIQEVFINLDYEPFDWLDVKVYINGDKSDQGTWDGISIIDGDYVFTDIVNNTAILKWNRYNSFLLEATDLIMLEYEYQL